MQPKKLPYAERMLKKEIGGRLEPIKISLRRLYKSMLNVKEKDYKNMSDFKWASLETLKDLRQLPNCKEVNYEIEYALYIAREAQSVMNFRL